MSRKNKNVQPPIALENAKAAGVHEANAGRARRLGKGIFAAGALALLGAGVVAAEVITGGAINAFAGPLAPVATAIAGNLIPSVSVAAVEVFAGTTAGFVAFAGRVGLGQVARAEHSAANALMQLAESQQPGIEAAAAV